ncbi:hypothetical protein IV498_12275 [Paenarthrobacter sp. Z7-10]|uniref:hypothetical protein n=1 Tax=Paenarthrobacter sp. Z7-10 TaxID=2787635 RepID=UPI0022A90283|nr:hypothetical protein [Paenarthrobacter sp. Z7-10]MCZ2403935.1 hypothetical protein [Paenarthrobacter sp. Z7-10]
MLTQLAGAAIIAAETEEKAPLFMPWWMFGVVIFGILLVLMFVCMSFSNMGNRHEPVDESADPHRQHTNKHDHGQAEEISHS